MNLDNFERPWEHLRLLSDGPRNEALLTLLQRRAPGAVVAEIGCGTGLLSLAAAKLGAERVYAIEPTKMADIAEQLVKDNGLGHVIEILRGKIEDFEPRPVDLAFSELLNADPFSEGVASAMRAARPWTAHGGRLSPSELRVWVALVSEGSSAREARRARGEIARIGSRYGLVLDALLEGLARPGSYRGVTSALSPVSLPACAWSLTLGQQEPEPEVTVEVTPLRAGPVGGAVVWFEAALDEGLTLSNAPGGEDHWGQLLCAWPEERGVREGAPVRLQLSLAGGEVDVRFAG